MRLGYPAGSRPEKFHLLLLFTIFASADYNNDVQTNRE